MGISEKNDTKEMALQRVTEPTKQRKKQGMSNKTKQDIYKEPVLLPYLCGFQAF